MGDVGASDATWGLHMRGQKLIQAMIARLYADHGFGNATDIIFAGGSAGARVSQALSLLAPLCF